MVFDRPEDSDLTVSFWSVLVPTVLGMTIFAALVVFSVGRSMLVPSVAGVDEIVGLVGKAASTLDPTGRPIVWGVIFPPWRSFFLPLGQPWEP